MNWLVGFGNEPRRHRPPPVTPIGWTKGQRRTTVIVACCDECGHDKLKVRSSKDSIVFLICKKCGHNFKDSPAPRLA